MTLATLRASFLDLPTEEQEHAHAVNRRLLAECQGAGDYFHQAGPMMWAAAREYKPSHTMTATSSAVLQIQGGNHSPIDDGQILIAAMRGRVPKEAFDALARLLAAAGLGISYSKQNRGT